MTVTQENPQTIVIQPANPQVVYVPTYNPTVVYGTPYYPPGYSTGAMVATGLISFGVGMAVGAAISGGWGWNNWGCGWHGGTVVYNRNTYVSRSNVYANGNRYNNGNWTRPTPYGNNNYNRNGNNINGGNRNNNNINNGNRPNNGNLNGNNRPNNGNLNTKQPANNEHPIATTRKTARRTPQRGSRTSPIAAYGQAAGGNQERSLRRLRVRRQRARR